MTPQAVAVAHAMRADDMSTRQIARRLGVPVSTVSGALRPQKTAWAVIEQAGEAA